MKKLLCICVLVCLATEAHADSAQVRFAFNALSPRGPDRNWESAYGMEVGLVQWLSPALGLAGSVGFARWQARETALSEHDPGSSSSFAARIDGDASVLPVGMSILLRPVSGHAAHLSVETGLRYAMVSSDVRARYAYSDSYSAGSGYGRIDLDDVVYGIVAFDLVLPVSPSARVSLGAGYQFDISKGDATLDGSRIGDSSLEASLVRIGFTAGF